MDNILTEADGLVKDIKPNLVVTVGDVQGITSNVHRLSTDAVDTVEYVTMSAVDTLENLSTGISTATDYVSIVKGILESVKSILGK